MTPLYFLTRMERWNGRIALVTGASVGIGAAICRELVKYGMTVIGCARNVKKIEELAHEDGVLICPGKIYAVKCDLSNESEILAMFNEIRQKFGRIDVCINNAGFSTNSPLLSGEISDWRNMLEVNVLALCICNRESIKIMQEKNIDDGQIINISSMGGHRIPSSSQMFALNFYCGTKYMVRALTEGLRREVKGTNMHIRVASISPGLVETEFAPRLFEGNSELSGAFYGSIDCLQASDIADAVAYILKSPPHVDINDILIRPVEQFN